MKTVIPSCLIFLKQQLQGFIRFVKTLQDTPAFAGGGRNAAPNVPLWITLYTSSKRRQDASVSGTEGDSFQYGGLLFLLQQLLYAGPLRPDIRQRLFLQEQALSPQKHPCPLIWNGSPSFLRQIFSGYCRNPCRHPLCLPWHFPPRLHNTARC